jgi:hypothetical protein
MAAELKTPELSRHAATAFADKWKNITGEKQHARGFWSDFFRTLCGIDDEEIADFQKIFNMTFEEFQQKPSWKQMQLKRSAHLF